MEAIKDIFFNSPVKRPSIDNNNSLPSPSRFKSAVKDVFKVVVEAKNENITIIEDDDSDIECEDIKIVPKPVESQMEVSQNYFVIPGIVTQDEDLQNSLGMNVAKSETTSKINVAKRSSEHLTAPKINMTRKSSEPQITSKFNGGKNDSEFPTTPKMNMARIDTETRITPKINLSEKGSKPENTRKIIQATPRINASNKESEPQTNSRINASQKGSETQLEKHLRQMVEQLRRKNEMLDVRDKKRKEAMEKRDMEAAKEVEEKKNEVEEQKTLINSMTQKLDEKQEEVKNIKAISNKNSKLYFQKLMEKQDELAALSKEVEKLSSDLESLQKWKSSQIVKEKETVRKLTTGNVAKYTIYQEKIKALEKSNKEKDELIETMNVKIIDKDQLANGLKLKVSKLITEFTKGFKDKDAQLKANMQKISESSTEIERLKQIILGLTTKQINPPGEGKKKEDICISEVLTQKDSQLIPPLRIKSLTDLTDDKESAIKDVFSVVVEAKNKNVTIIEDGDSDIECEEIKTVPKPSENSVDIVDNSGPSRQIQNVLISAAKKVVAKDKNKFVPIIEKILVEKSFLSKQGLNSSLELTSNINNATNLKRKSEGSADFNNSKKRRICDYRDSIDELINETIAYVVSFVEIRNLF